MQLSLVDTQPSENPAVSVLGTRIRLVTFPLWRMLSPIDSTPSGIMNSLTVAPANAPVPISFNSKFSANVTEVSGHPANALIPMLCTRAGIEIAVSFDLWKQLLPIVSTLSGRSMEVKAVAVNTPTSLELEPDKCFTTEPGAKVTDVSLEQL